MTQALYPATKKRRIRERPNDAAEKLNPFSPALNTETGRPQGHRPPDGPRLETQRRVLLDLRARLQGSAVQAADAALTGSTETTSASPDTADRACEIVEQDLALSLLGSAADTLDQIEAALDRIEDGSYGHCAECETRIPAARLEAIPYATCCVECAARRERAA